MTTLLLISLAVFSAVGAVAQQETERERIVRVENTIEDIKEDVSNIESSQAQMRMTQAAIRESVSEVKTIVKALEEHHKNDDKRRDDNGGGGFLPEESGFYVLTLVILGDKARYYVGKRRNGNGAGGD